MSDVSKAQARLMQAVAASDSLAAKLGIKRSVAQEFVAADHGRSLKNLPEHVKPKA